MRFGGVMRAGALAMLAAGAALGQTPAPAGAAAGTEAVRQAVLGYYDALQRDDDEAAQRLAAGPMDGLRAVGAYSRVRALAAQARRSTARFAVFTAACKESDPARKAALFAQADAADFALPAEDNPLTPVVQDHEALRSAPLHMEDGRAIFASHTGSDGALSRSVAVQHSGGQWRVLVDAPAVNIVESMAAVTEALAQQDALLARKAAGCGMAAPLQPGLVAAFPAYSKAIQAE